MRRSQAAAARLCEAIAANRERRIQALQARADYLPLLQRLKKIIETETKKTLRPVDCQELESCVFDVVCHFEAAENVHALLSRYNLLHELAAPLTRMIEILEDERVRDWVFLCLEAPLGPQRLDRQAVPARLENLLVDLRKIARRVPAPPAKRSPGRPVTSGGLYGAVKLLALYWEQLTGKRFTQYWHSDARRHNRAPANNATQFVHAVIRFIAPERLRSLPKMTEWIVAERGASSLN